MKAKAGDLYIVTYRYYFCPIKIVKPLVIYSYSDSKLTAY